MWSHHYVQTNSTPTLEFRNDFQCPLHIIIDRFLLHTFNRSSVSLSEKFQLWPSCAASPSATLVYQCVCVCVRIYLFCLSRRVISAPLSSSSLQMCGWHIWVASTSGVLPSCNTVCVHEGIVCERVQLNTRMHGCQVV